MVARDKKRAFSTTQKNQILYQQNNKCGKCHKPLDMRAIEYHHIKPWSAGGRTITVNGAALCPTCHKIIGHEERLKEQEKPVGKQTKSSSKSGATTKPRTSKKKVSPIEEYDRSVKKMNRDINKSLDRIFKL